MVMASNKYASFDSGKEISALESKFVNLHCTFHNGKLCQK